MRGTTELFQINGKPMLIPDEEVQVTYEDLDAAESGRDESGYMHRFPVRYKVPSWNFSYHWLTEEEKQYMEGLFPEAATFQFTHPSRLAAGESQSTTCYRSQYTIVWKNAATGLWSGYGFRIISC